MWGEGAGLQDIGLAFAGLGAAALGQGRLQLLAELPSTHLRFPEFQRQVRFCRQRSPCGRRGLLSPGQAAPSLSGHTHFHSAWATPPKGARGLGQPPPCQWGPPGHGVDKTGTPLAPSTVLAAAACPARTMRLLSGTGLVQCGLLLLLFQALCTLGLAPQARGEGVHVRWGT